MVADGLIGQPMFEMRRLIKPDALRFENDDLNTMHQTYKFAERLNCDWINFYCLVDQNVN